MFQRKFITASLTNHDFTTSLLTDNKNTFQYALNLSALHSGIKHNIQIGIPIIISFKINNLMPTMPTEFDSKPPFNPSAPKSLVPKSVEITITNKTIVDSPDTYINDNAIKTNAPKMKNISNKLKELFDNDSSYEPRDTSSTKSKEIIHSDSSTLSTTRRKRR